MQFWDKGARRTCETSSTSIAICADEHKLCLFLSKGDSVFVEFSFVLLSFLHDRLGCSFKVLLLLWDIPAIFPLTQINWCELVTFCTNSSVGSAFCFLTHPAPSSCPHPAPQFRCHQLTPSLLAWPSTVFPLQFI